MSVDQQDIDLGMNLSISALHQNLGDLETATRSFVDDGGTLDRSVSDSLRIMRNLALPQIELLFADYKTHTLNASAGEDVEGEASDAMTAFNVAKDVLKLQLAITYDGLSVEAKSLLDDSSAFDVLVANREIYVNRLQENFK